MRTGNLFLRDILAIILLPIFAMGTFHQPGYASDPDQEKPGDFETQKMQTIHDQTDEKTAEDKTAFGGDVFSLGWYERPFDQEMKYLPFIDIQKAAMGRQDPVWIYVQLTMVDPVQEGSAYWPFYGIELDTDLDSRGDFLILAMAPGNTEWNTRGVVILTSYSRMVGGEKPALADQKRSSVQGYDTVIYDSGIGNGKDLAWARISPQNSKIVELAFMNSFIGGSNAKFIWIPWALAGQRDGMKFDFNDHFTHEEAGSPLKIEAQYPLKRLWGVDNTPRYPSGFELTASMPGVGKIY
ncbi:MAG: hypothetical protein GYA15_16025 [Leptolinea sp.]|nr:hypothetical protein [Leptolinea sp.]